MEMKITEPADSGLVFFGKMSASISHEIKNVLAIINENAGLTEDLIALAEKGRPLDLGRIKALASKVRQQVQRGDQIVKTMNLFAHSADNKKGEILPADFLALMVSLSRRLASIKGFEIDVRCDKGIPEITTIPFFLENLLWLLIEYAMQVGEGERRLILCAGELDGKLQIGIKLSPFRGSPNASVFPGERERRLAEALDADLIVDPEKGEVSVLLKIK
ncbi:MAG: sensor histidine kinase [Desulfobacteraceae bacterium]|jgi:signal transduction histidine kinase|nr:MAG: sensor histidine kinase [Desulfobacteraceae bacterium]